MKHTRITTLQCWIYWVVEQLQPGQNQDKNQDRTRTEPGQNQDRTRTEPGQNQDRTRTEPGQNQDRTRTEPGQNQDRIRTESGPDQDRTRTEPGQNQDRTRTEPGVTRLCVLTIHLYLYAVLAIRCPLSHECRDSLPPPPPQTVL